MNLEDLPDNSDSSDEDYIPDNTNTNLPSEEESDGNVSDTLDSIETTGSTKRRRNKKVSKSRKKSKSASPTPITKTEDKQSTDDLWADFKKDTGFKTRAERKIDTVTSVPNSTSIPNNSIVNNVAEPVVPRKVTEVFKFAGEEFKVEKDISIPSSSKMPLKRPTSGGMNSILSSLGKKTKINTLEKSKLDWDRFKKEENIEDELHAYGKSKDGYLERQDFLQRADLRRFEIEKDIRSNIRSNRMNF